MRQTCVRETSQNVNNQNLVNTLSSPRVPSCACGASGFWGVFERLLVDPAPQEGLVAAVDFLGSAELVPPAVGGIELPA